jgi:D-alanyl-lipoteichoic acid acyltransferase DltB (MBOAT superfamily)
MLFSSLEFLLGFLPLVVAITAALRRMGLQRFVPGFLLLASLVFYGWHVPIYVALICASIAANYCFGILLDRRRSSALLAAGVGFNLLLLGWFKYAGFLAANVGALTGLPLTLADIVLPLAISFFTFQQIAYLVDVSRGEAEPHRLLDYALFVTFFPQLIAGPIVHHKELVPAFHTPRFARFDAVDVMAGLFLFAIGLGKKVLIADPLRTLADPAFEAAALGIAPSMLEAWLGALAYGFQIYFDFSGYSDMALGLGRMFGVRLPENFASPYKAASIIEFWRRWHMTLSRFLRDYLYMPLGGNRRGPLRRHLNLMLVMLLGGLWHGANWTFVAWGGLHGLLLVVNHAWRHFNRGRIAIPRPLAILLTFACVVVAWVFFRAGSLAQAIMVLEAMAGTSAAPAFSAALLFPLLPGLPYLVLAAVLAFGCPNGLELLDRLERADAAPRRRQRALLGCGVVAALSICTVFASGTYEFLYFQF